MDDLLKICQDILTEHELFHVKAFLKDRSQKTPHNLKILCDKNPELMASTISGIVLLERIKEGEVERKPDFKRYKSYRNRVIKKYFDATNMILRINPDNRKQIKNEFFKFMGSIYQYINFPNTDFTYNSILKLIVDELQKETGHKRNAVLSYLSKVLNKLNCTTPQNKIFNRQLLLDRIKRVTS